eukprot:2827857-Prymnesium_polylepis.2
MELLRDRRGIPQYGSNVERSFSPHGPTVQLICAPRDAQAGMAWPAEEWRPRYGRTRHRGATGPQARAAKWRQEWHWDLHTARAKPRTKDTYSTLVGVVRSEGDGVVYGYPQERNGTEYLQITALTRHAHGCPILEQRCSQKM